MIFGYSLAESKKFVIMAITMIGAIVGMFIAYDPGINQAAISLAGALISLIGVFFAPQFSEEDFTKGVNAVTGALIALGNYWYVLNPSTEMKVYTGIGSAVALFLVIRANNEKAHNIPSGGAVT